LYKHDFKLPLAKIHKNTWNAYEVIIIVFVAAAPPAPLCTVLEAELEADSCTDATNTSCVGNSPTFVTTFTIVQVC
jgi:hypothetical protein